MSTRTHAPTGTRQGNPQIGLEICTHTCGCVAPGNALAKGRRKPKFLRLCPVFVKEGASAKAHVANSQWHRQCGSSCPVFQNRAYARELTDEEYTVWTPHLGHATELHHHIPTKYHHLLPAEPQPDDYQGVFPTHPLIAPNAPSQPPPLISQSSSSLAGDPTALTLPQLSLPPLALTPSSQPPITALQPPPVISQASSFLAGFAFPQPSLPPPQKPPVVARAMSMDLLPVPTSSGSADVAARRTVCFVEAPRIGGWTLTIAECKELLTFYTYVDAVPTSPSENTAAIHKALTTAPPGYAFLEPVDSDDVNQNIHTWQIHDMVIVYPSLTSIPPQLIDQT